MVFFKQPYDFSLIGLIIGNIPIGWPKFVPFPKQKINFWQHLLPVLHA